MIINSRFEHIDEYMSVDANLSGQIGIKNVAREFNTRIYVNEVPAYDVVCSPYELEYLSIGRLVSEGIVKSKDEIETVYVCDTGARVSIFLKEKVDFGDRLNVIKVSTCCTDNINYLKERELTSVGDIDVSDEEIHTLVDLFENSFPLYEKTHAVHSAVIMHNGKTYYSEDIGRHNAIDKVLGKALYEGIDLTKAILFTSGRVPTDMTRKVVLAGVPCLIAKGSPTYESVIMSKKYNLKLITNASKKGYNIF